MSKLYINDVIFIANAELGYMEKASNKELDDKTANSGNNNFTKYARDLWNASPHFYQGPKQGYEWCCVFVDWCMYMACEKDSEHTKRAKYYTGPYGAGVEFAAKYYKDAGEWHTDPKPGDQIFFGNYAHTGLVVDVDSDTVYTIEGNEGNMVSRRSYARTSSYIIGYGRPKYDGVMRPTEHPFVDVPSDAWYSDAVKWAYTNGIVAGVDETHFSPNTPATRAMLVQMLYKMNMVK